MQYLSKPYYFALFAISVILLSNACKKEETLDEDPEETEITNEPGTVTAKIDGEFFKNNGFFSVSSSLSINDDSNEYRFNFSAERDKNGVEDRITFSLFGLDFESLKEGAVFAAGSNINEGGLNFDGDFYRISRVEGDDTDIITDSEQNANSTCTITKLDRENRLISGTFAFKSIEIFGSGQTFVISDGVFTELPY